MQQRPDACADRGAGKWRAARRIEVARIAIRNLAHSTKIAADIF